MIDLQNKIIKTKKSNLLKVVNYLKKNNQKVSSTCETFAISRFTTNKFIIFDSIIFIYRDYWDMIY